MTVLSQINCVNVVVAFNAHRHQNLMWIVINTFYPGFTVAAPSDNGCVSIARG